MTAPDEPILIDYPVRREDPFELPAAYRAAMLESPVRKVRLWDDSQAWLVTRYDDVRMVLSDPRFSADAQRPGFPFLSAAQRATLRNNRAFIRMDPPEHTRLRRTLAREFTVRAVSALEPMTRTIVDDVVEALVTADQPVDLVRALALPVPSLVIARLLGVPERDQTFFQDASAAMLDWRSTPESVVAARADLKRYLADLIDRLALERSDGILSRLLTDYERIGVVTREEVVTMALLLLVAGHDTTANMIALSVLALLRNPQQLAALLADPGLAPGAVDELLRYLTIVHTGQARLATDDVEIGGVTIAAGEGTIALLPTANADPAVFPDPGELRLDRAGASNVAFGFGPHQCLGQHLARLELRVVLERIRPYLPSMRVAVPFEKIEFRHDMLMYGVHELPVTFTP
jgi:cytochrome P450